MKKSLCIAVSAVLIWQLQIDLDCNNSHFKGDFLLITVKWSEQKVTQIFPSGFQEVLVTGLHQIDEDKLLAKDSRSFWMTLLVKTWIGLTVQLI